MWVVEFKYTFFLPCFVVPFSTLSFLLAVAFLFYENFVIIQELFYTARYYMVTSSIQMSNKYEITIYGLPLF